MQVIRPRRNASWWDRHLHRDIWCIRTVSASIFVQWVLWDHRSKCCEAQRTHRCRRCSATWPWRWIAADRFPPRVDLHSTLQMPRVRVLCWGCSATDFSFPPRTLSLACYMWSIGRSVLLAGESQRNNKASWVYTGKSSTMTTMLYCCCCL